ncbi:hypothetical protein DSECCO2_347100 [anaerobic digester metagenome]
MVDGDREARRETGKLPPPVSDDRHGADEERGCRRGAPLLFGEEVGDHLHGLSKPHIVGKAGAAPVARKKREPRETALLVRPESARERRRLRDGLERSSFPGPVKEPAEPSLRRDIAHRRAARVCSRGDAEEFAGRHGASGIPPRESLERLLDLVSVDRAPLAVHPHQGDLQGRELLELFRRYRFIAEGDRPVVGDERGKTEPSLLLPGRFGREVEGRPGGRALPPRGKYDAKAAVHEERGPFTEERVGLRRIEVHPRRARGCEA